MVCSYIYVCVCVSVSRAGVVEIQSLNHHPCFSGESLTLFLLWSAVLLLIVLYVCIQCMYCTIECTVNRRKVAGLCYVLPCFFLFLLWRLPRLKNQSGLCNKHQFSSSVSFEKFFFLPGKEEFPMDLGRCMYSTQMPNRIILRREYY